MDRDAHEILGINRFTPWAEVRAAYLALARRHHPDGATPDCARMAEINAAYETLEHRRRASDAQPRLVPTGPGHPPAEAGHLASAAPARPAPGSLLGRVQAAGHVDSPALDFGQYRGWRIADVARHDPRYLRWLSRHSSGFRFRKAIEQVLGQDSDIGRRAAILL